MDYTEGAVDVPASVLIDKAEEKLGPMSLGNSQFRKEHLYDLIDDSRYYVLTLENARRLVHDMTVARTWKKSRRDCDTRTFMFASDIAEFAYTAGWEYGLAIWRIKYDSRSLTDNPKVRLAGYHATPLIWTFDEEGGDYEPYLIQPKNLLDNGVETNAVFQRPQEEILFWVVAEGMA